MIDDSAPTGLGEAEARQRLAADGPNELPSAGPRRPWRIALEVLREPMFGLLLAGVAYLTTRGKGKSSYSSDDNADYRAGSRSGSGYKQGGWAGYAGGKSAARRSSESSSRPIRSTRSGSCGPAAGGSAAGARRCGDLPSNSSPRLPRPSAWALRAATVARRVSLEHRRAGPAG